MATRNACARITKLTIAVALLKSKMAKKVYVSDQNFLSVSIGHSVEYRVFSKKVLKGSQAYIFNVFW